MNIPIAIYFGSRKSKRLFQLGDDFQVLGKAREINTLFGGAPAVLNMIKTDDPDVWFTKDWQFALVAWNMGMKLAAIMAIMGDPKALMNGTGIDGDRNNYLTGKTGFKKDPCTDRFRSFALSTHECIEDGDWLIPVAMDGSQPPPMKPGRKRPQTLSDIYPEDYLYHPMTDPEKFCVCSNVRWKSGPKRLGYGPWANGIIPKWMPAGSPIYTFFPFVTRQYSSLRTPKRWWNEIQEGQQIPSPYRP